MAGAAATARGASGRRRDFRHHPALQGWLPAVAAPEFPSQSNEVQPHVAPDQRGQPLAREGPDAAGAGQPERLVWRQIGHGIDEGRIHLGEQY